MGVSKTSLPTYCLAIAGGVIVAHAVKYGGLGTELHERAHALAGGFLVRGTPVVVNHDWANWSHVVAASDVGSKLRETAKVLFGYYGVAGHTIRRAELNRLGAFIGLPAVWACIAVAGPASTLMVHLAALIAGIHQREKRPALAAFLMSAAVAGHFLDCDYPLSDWAGLSSSSVEDVKKLVIQGNDFVRIAVCLDYWGFHYSSAAYAVAVGWTASVPLVGFWALSQADQDQPSEARWYTKVLWEVVFSSTLFLAAALEEMMIEKTGPLFAIHASAIVVGVHQRKRRPRLARFLITFSLMAHLTASHHPLNVLGALTSSERIRELAKKRDSLLVTYFVLRELTGVSITRLSAFVSKALLMSVPLIGMGVSFWFADDKVDRLPV